MRLWAIYFVTAAMAVSANGAFAQQAEVPKMTLSVPLTGEQAEVPKTIAGVVLSTVQGEVSKVVMYALLKKGGGVIPRSPLTHW